MKFKVGDRVKVRSDLKLGNEYGKFIVSESMAKFAGEVVTISKVYRAIQGYRIKDTIYGTKWTDDMFEGFADEHKTDAEVMKGLIGGRNNKGQSVERPSHYENNGKDLFDELYDRLYHSKKMFTGREVFIIVMKFVAERYIRRYPNKNDEDLKKGIYSLERLKEYEEMEK